MGSNQEDKIASRPAKEIIKRKIRPKELGVRKIKKTKLRTKRTTLKASFKGLIFIKMAQFTIETLLLINYNHTLW